ncbi:Gar1/Naf1 RNA binding region-domain-containing protein [Mycena maculata]|uniref:H/ACA ribonucleoprotein complex subunit n=1 Tax=Mycena maculata TaxID=230809 RepID=A0AAD7I4Q7_9AGAR|nr:Gar1/Naf1 RNA binding region-domain-containing protein [Mycena maculata]
MNRGGSRGGFRGGGGRGGGRGGFQQRDFGPPDTVLEMGTFVHAVEDEMLCSSLMPDKVPYFNAPIYLQNKSVIGKVDEILGPINEVYFSIKMGDGMVASSFKKGDKVYIGGDKLLPIDRFLPKPKVAGGVTSEHAPIHTNVFFLFIYFQNEGAAEEHPVAAEHPVEGGEAFSREVVFNVAVREADSATVDGVQEVEDLPLEVEAVMVGAAGRAAMLPGAVLVEDIEGHSRAIHFFHATFWSDFLVYNQ